MLYVKSYTIENNCMICDAIDRVWVERGFPVGYYAEVTEGLLTKDDPFVEMAPYTGFNIMNLITNAALWSVVVAATDYLKNSIRSSKHKTREEK